MVNHGRLFKYLFLPFLSENPMAEPWPAKLRLVQVPSLLVGNRYKGSLLTWDSFVQTGVQWLHKGNFKVCRPASKWVSVWSPYFCIDIFSGVRNQKLVQCESEITKRDHKLAYVMCNFWSNLKPQFDMILLVAFNVMTKFAKRAYIISQLAYSCLSG